MTLKPSEYMQEALSLATQGLYTTQPNPRVGCVIVRDHQIIGQGFHQRSGEAHAEIHALRQAGEAARGATCYVTLEPCCHHGRTGPCVEALIEAGVAEVVMAMIDPNPRVAGQGKTALEKAGIIVSVGLLEAEARELNPGFIKRMEKGLPFVRAKMAMSLDGRVALSNGQSQWISSEASRADVQKLRARSSVIVTGVGTVLADDPELTVRLPETTRQPLRLILDSQLRTPLDARILKNGPVCIATLSKNQKKIAAFKSQGAEIWPMPSCDQGVDLLAVLKKLAECECNEVHLEGGAALLGSFIREKHVDECVLYIAPLLLGDKARALVEFPALKDLSEAIKGEIMQVSTLGPDLKYEWRIKNCQINKK